MTFDDIVDLAEKAGCDVSAMDGSEYQAMWCDYYQLERFAASLIQAGAASRDAEVAELKRQVEENAKWMKLFREQRDQLHNQVAMLRHALIHTCSHTRIDSGFDRDLVDNALSEPEPK